jgi:dihydroxyacetone kinase-like protein
MFVGAAKAIIEQKDYFSELDMLGDADFGTNISKGFELVVSRLADENNPDIGRVLDLAGETFTMDVGSTIGGLLGQALSEAAKGQMGRRSLDAAGLAAILRAMLDSITRIGGAKLGEKTIIDALEPATRTAEIVALALGTIREALGDAASAAEAGSRNTVDMVATKGRSSYLGERSKGKADPGAAFAAFFLKAMSQNL